MIADVMLIIAPMICYTDYKYFIVLVALIENQSIEIVVGIPKAPFTQNWQKYVETWSSHPDMVLLQTIATKLEVNNCIYML